MTQMRRALLAGILSLLFTITVRTQQPPNPKLVIYQGWNECVMTFRAEMDERDIWHKLQDSLQLDPPEFVKSLDRIAIYNELIVLHERRLKALHKMLEAEKR